MQHWLDLASKHCFDVSLYKRLLVRSDGIHTLILATILHQEGYKAYLMLSVLQGGKGCTVTCYGVWDLRSEVRKYQE